MPAAPQSLGNRVCSQKTATFQLRKVGISQEDRSFTGTCLTLREMNFYTDKRTIIYKAKLGYKSFWILVTVIDKKLSFCLNLHFSYFERDLHIQALFLFIFEVPGHFLYSFFY